LERAAGFSCALPEQVFEGAEGFAGGISRARVDLKTGRPHQIRAQMAAIGCPLVGDHQYGSGPATAPRISPRTGLCCSTLSDWDRRAGSWKPVIGWKPTALTGVK